VFAGIRPLVRSGAGRKTSQLGRDHLVHASPSGLVSIIGGKWTTYRKMAEDCVDLAARVGGLRAKPCQTTTLRIHGGNGRAASSVLGQYGSDATAVAQLNSAEPTWGERLDERLPYLAGQVVWAARYEMARTVEDVLARRVRMLFIDSAAALSAAPKVAALLATEFGKDAAWQADQIAKFENLVASYQPPIR
jgi:glycerol-3-phosphate dehydrogenase